MARHGVAHLFLRVKRRPILAKPKSVSLGSWSLRELIAADFFKTFSVPHLTCPSTSKSTFSGLSCFVSDRQHRSAAEANSLSAGLQISMANPFLMQILQAQGHLQREIGTIYAIQKYIKCIDHRNRTRIGPEMLTFVAFSQWRAVNCLKILWPTSSAGCFLFDFLFPMRDS